MVCAHKLSNACCVNNVLSKYVCSFDIIFLKYNDLLFTLLSFYKLLVLSADMIISKSLY